MRYLWIAVIAAGLAFGQQTGKPQQAKVIRLQNSYSQAVLHLVGQIASTSGVAIGAPPAGNANIVTLSGPPDAVTVIENLIKEIDAPPQSVEVTAYMLLGGNQPADKLPTDLEPVVKQLRATFPYTQYKVLESIVTRAVAGHESNTRGLLPGHANAKYQFMFQRAEVDAKQNPAVITLRSLQLGAEIPSSKDEKGNLKYEFAGIVHTDVTLRVGQKVVIGKASLGPSTEPLFLVLSAKVAE